MKKTMKTTFSTIIALLFVASATVYAQQSDYQIQQDFRASHSELVDRIDNATTSGELSEISSDIDALEADYSEYSSIINAALYPDTFSGKVRDLRNRYNSAYGHVSALADANERISELMAQVDDFRNRLAEMDEEIADLKQQIDRSSANERRQAALIRQYRQNIEQRDAFVSEVLEQLMKRYQEVDSATQAEIADALERLSDNPIELLKTIIAEYTSMADQDSGLEAPDYVRMRAQHGYFSDVWSRIGERLSNTFAPDNPVEARQEVSDMLAAWLSSIDNKLWNALTTAFNQNGIELPAFTSASTFNTALNTYVDNAIEVSQESNSEEDYQTFRNFSNYWNNTVKAQWGELMVNGGILSTSQIAAIDVKLNTWGEASTPTSNLMFILFLIALAVIIGLVVLLVTKKS
jgi:hypothetical protein